MVGFINLPVIKNVHKYLQLKKQISKAVFKENKTVIVVYSLATAYLRAAVEIKRIHSNVKICVIITDLHEFPGDCSFFQKAYINYIEKPIFYKLLSQIDCFVVVTEKIIEYLGVENKPWVRVEGLYDPSEPAQLPQVDNKNLKVILYAGTLHTRYGIGELLDAFKMIKADDYRLWICGDGGGIELVKNAALTDERIKYLGIVPKQKVSELQRQATILINPRNTNGEYNKYSFPSKTIEYLSSGTPALMYKLDGIPEEYYEYCYTISGSSIEDMSKAMYEVCQLDDKTLKSKGTLAREFILNNKSSEIQCKKILAMLKKL
ncbi:MAG: glycosyltransferase family 4 protein [Acidobacteriota bacterium]